MSEGRTIRVAINGFGRIGKNVLRAILARAGDAIEVVAINDLAILGEAAHLFRYDSVHGQFLGTVVAYVDRSALVVNDHRIPYYSERDPAQLPWGTLGVDVVLECTGLFLDPVTAGAHIAAGAKRVIISTPGKDGVPMFVYGVNDDRYDGQPIISNASCTTNCGAPIARVIDNTEFGITHASLITVHAATAGENVVDGTPPGRKGGDLRMARAALTNIILTKTGAAKSITEVLPHLAGKFDGFAVRVPTLDVSLCLFTFELERSALTDSIVNAFRYAEVYPKYRGVIRVTGEPLVSTDLVGDPCSAIIDLSFLRVVDGKLLTITAWYDNEWGYSCRMVDMVMHVIGPTLA